MGVGKGVRKLRAFKKFEKAKSKEVQKPELLKSEPFECEESQPAAGEW